MKNFGTIKAEDSLDKDPVLVKLWNNKEDSAYDKIEILKNLNLKRIFPSKSKEMKVFPGLSYVFLRP